MGQGSVVCFYDEVNTFPSMNWKDFHRSTCFEANEEDADVLVQRFEQALATIDDTEGDRARYRTQCGDRQGDGPASQRHILSQDPILRRWVRNTLGKR